ncbi:uncharacterized protein BYT42DRAFT_597048 [Radiomyces spectabilis]|uniref:uncharacterized protein n=1 Tax=Radiomyces spectabilis TaxID=64574 RepID=UPI002220E7E6|nr:uncharacterized protein BYT42DRAFT_597048 [Radiomyces spectabilis]KAI8391552.1 hypothetical protein BYT42DRAFT_597048 [Radiomyces spectabilis]
MAATNVANYYPELFTMFFPTTPPFQLHSVLRFKTTIFLFEDGHGNVVDENGGPEPMEYIVDQDEFVLSTWSMLPLVGYLEKGQKDEDIRMKEANVKRDYVRYTIQDKVRFFDLKIEKCMSASAAAKQLGIHIRTAQRWVKQYNACPDSIFESRKQHKLAVVGFIDANPSASVAEVTDHLLSRFDDLKVSGSTVYNFMRNECNLSLKKADFHFIERNSQAKIEERHELFDELCVS